MPANIPKQTVSQHKIRVKRFGARERVFFTASATMFLFMGVAFIQVTNQENLLRADAAVYQDALTLYEKGDFAAAAPIFAELLRRNTNSWILADHYGRCLGETGRFKEASIYYAKALERNVFLVRNGNFLMPWGYYSYRDRDFEKARVLLEAGLKTKPSNDLAAFAHRILEEIKRNGLK